MKNLFKTNLTITRREGVVRKLYGRLAFLAVMMMMAASATAAIEYKNYEYDFQSATSANDVVMSSTSYTRSDYGSWGAVVVGSSFKGNDMSKLAFRFSGGSSGNYSWFVENGNGLRNYSTPSYMVILGLRAGDIVTINHTGSNLAYAKFDGNVHAVYNDNQHRDFHDENSDTQIFSGTAIHITSDGDLVLKNSGDATIKNIKIQAIKNATYSITRNSNNSTTFAFTGDGLMDYNDVAVPYLRVSFGHPQNYVIVNGLQSYIYSFKEDEALKCDNNNFPIEGSFYTFAPTGNGHVTLTGNFNGTVHLFRVNSNGSFDWNNGSLHWGTWSGGNIDFDVQNGYTYYLCEDKGQTQGNAFRLHSLTFTNSFYLEDLGVLKDSSAPNGYLTKLYGATSSSLQTSVKRVSSNIDASNIQVTLNGNDLSISGLAFNDDSENKGGTVIVHLQATEGEADLCVTIPYDAGWGTWVDGYGSRTWGHVWNFSDPREQASNYINSSLWTSGENYNNTGLLDLGQASNSNSNLAKEIARREWIYAQRVTGSAGGFHDPMYTNVFDMVGDNADMIWETEGLWFDTETNLSCLWNESAANNYTRATDPDRYVGLLPDANGLSSFTIPGLKDGDRVEIFMGSGEASGGDVAFFEITGAKDALGTVINQEYGFGGSMWQLSGNRYGYRSCYQFIKDGDGGMKFTLKRGSMAKLYSIHIYRGEKSPQNNVIRKRDDIDGYQLLNTYKDGNVGDYGKEYQYTLHFRGKGETLFPAEVVALSGYFANNGPELTVPVYNDFVVKLKSRIGDFGEFRMRLKCADFNGHYVADYADQTLSVGYLEKKAYPYTWDFTDMKSWIDSYAQNDGLLKEWWHASQTDENKWLYVWRRFDAGTENESYGLNTNHNNDRSVTRDQIRTSGGQLYAGNIMLDESRGLGIETRSYDKNYNDRLRIMKDGINISGLTGNEWAFCVPEVDANAVVYVRALKMDGDSGHAPRFNCKIGSGEESAIANTIEIANDETGESVFIVKNTSGSAQDIRLYFNQVKVKKISVATDEKKVNEKGYTSESRNHAIDASLLPYFTGEDMRTYLVSSPDYDGLTVELTDFGNPNGVDNNGKYVIPANTGCIIRRVADGDDKSFDVLASGQGFHLFVPDMHDDDASEGKFADVNVNNQFMVAALTGMESGVPYTSNVTFNYVTLKHDGANLNDAGAVFFAYTWDNNGDQWIPEVDGKIYGLQQGANVIFVRMNPDYKNNPSWDGRWNQTANLTAQLGAICELSYSGDNLAANWQTDATAQNVDMTNYVLTYKYYKLNGSTLTGPFSGDEKFYRVYSNQTVKLRPNSAYMQLPTSEVKPEGSSAAPRAPKFSFKFNDNILGDVNDDRSVDVADFTSLANYILGRTPETFIEKAADVNKDNGIDVADFTGVANIILGFKADGTRRAPVMTDADAIYVEPFTAIPGTQQVLSVRMDNSMPMTGYEFTLSLPQGITLASDADGIMASMSNDRTTARYTNFFGSAIQADGTLKVLCGTTAADSDGLYTFSGNSGEVARITVNIPENYTQGVYQATIISAKYTDQMGNAYILAGNATTGISTVEAAVETEPDTYYTLSGQKLNGRPSQRGFYIVNGKKVMVK